MHTIFDDENIYNLLDEDISQPDIENFLKIYRPRSKHNLSNEEIIYLIQKERDRQKNILEVSEEESSDIDISFLKKEFDTLIQENVSDEDFVSNREKMEAACASLKKPNGANQVANHIADLVSKIN